MLHLCCYWGSTTTQGGATKLQVCVTCVTYYVRKTHDLWLSAEEKKRSCFAVWWKGTDTGVSFGPCADTSPQRYHWCLVDGYELCFRSFKSLATEPSCPGLCTNHACLWRFPSEHFPYLSFSFLNIKSHSCSLFLKECISAHLYTFVFLSIYIQICFRGIYVSIYIDIHPPLPSFSSFLWWPLRAGLSFRRPSLVTSVSKTASFMAAGPT